MPLAYINFVSGGHPDQGLPAGSPGMPDQGLPGSQPGIDNSLPTPPPGVWPPPTVANPIVPIPPGPQCRLAPSGRRSSAAPVPGIAGSPGHPSQGLPGAQGIPHRACQARRRIRQGSRCQPHRRPVGTPPQPQPIATPPASTKPPASRVFWMVAATPVDSDGQLRGRRPARSTLACRCRQRQQPK